MDVAFIEVVAIIDGTIWLNCCDGTGSSNLNDVAIATMIDDDETISDAIEQAVRFVTK